MKLHFPHGEHPDVMLESGQYTIGGDNAADITIEDKGLADIHVTLTVKGSDYSVSVPNEASLVSINGKLVKDDKEVRAGDLLIASQVHMKLLDPTAKEKSEDDGKTRIRMALPQFILRGVSGAYFGKTYPLRGTTTIGRHSDCHICVNADGVSRRHMQIDADATGLVIKDLDSSNGTFVNGKKVKTQELQVGDEIRIDNIRFLVQTPGMSDPTLDQTDKKPKQRTEPPASSGGGAAKWIVTLVILGGAVAAAWYFGYLDGLLG
ncbi:FHA domain-containing protein [Marinicella gelatinilytica]|uniref:FHA domain-containing protein n=1 Tax=Marinicella gelatinilytica TaxID=2996017 RepID=UPI002260E954|nr:FHA domain-containing protein [Marinicella gelatinilytica]MCX7543767.1 FHA domain-containing protein [Marinicella gelatinilytica]